MIKFNQKIHGGCHVENKDCGFAYEGSSIYGSICRAWDFATDCFIFYVWQAESESTQSNISNESSTYKNDAVYRAGIYESQFVIGENTINLEVALDEEQVKSVKVKNLDESVETMYPLMKSAVKDVSKQLSSGVSIDEVVLSKNSMYTEKLVLDAVKTVLDEQKL